jgi:TonB family protein
MISLRRLPLARCLLALAFAFSILVPRAARADDPPPSTPAPLAGIKRPQPKNYVPLPYPPDAEKNREAVVVLSLDIDADGHVIRAVVAEPAGHGFDEAALEAGKKLEFTPAQQADGTPFAVRIKFRYPFAPEGSAPAPAQQTQATFSGLVLARGGDVAIAGATVTLTPAGTETHTDVAGAFAFKDLAPGKYGVVVRAPGYAAFAAEETLAAGEATEVKYRLVPSTGALEVTVEGERPPREVVKRTLDEAEIERIPGTNGDALRSLQSLPGVARPPALLGLLIVRGSAPQDTQTFIDGTPVPIIYHFGGLSSVVPTEGLKKIDFYPGNFGTQYGRVQGGIVDVGLRDPKSDLHGLAQIDLIDARLMLEGTIPGTDGWTFLAAGRRSYIDAWLGKVLSSAGASLTEAPVYYDYQFMLAKKPTKRSSLRISFFGSDDSLALLLSQPSASQPELSGDVGLHTAFQRLQILYTNDVTEKDRLSLVLAFGRDEVEFGIGSLYFDLDFRSLSGRAEYSRKLGRGMTLDAGLDMLVGYYDVSVNLPPPPVPGMPPNGPFSSANAVQQQLTGGAFQPAGYVEMEIAPDARSRIVPGVRLDYFNITDQLDFSPRVNARYDLHHDFPRSTLKAGVGLYHQQPQFQEVSPPFGTPNLKSNRSVQYALGAEQEFTRYFEASVEGFYKQLDNQVVGAASTTGTQLTYTNLGTGYVVGTEVLLKYKADEHFFGWVAYTLSRSVRTDAPGQAPHLFEYDQPQVLTVLGSYKLGHGWEFGARFRLTSGDPITPNVCSIGSPGCNPNRTNALFNGSSGTYVAIPLTGPYTERLPLFHQLDLRIDKRWKFNRWQLSTYLDVQNVYNRSNVEGITYNFNFTARSYVAGLPILPILGLRGEL